MSANPLSNSTKNAKSQERLPGSRISYLVISMIGAWLVKKLFTTPPGREIEI